MRSISTKFSLIVGLFALMFSGFVLYRTWSATQSHLETLTDSEGEMALNFDQAIREYVAKTIRPEIRKRLGKDVFVPEFMSSSFMARSIFEKVHRSLPDYIIKFSSDNPRNPANIAGADELKMLKYFQDHPGASRWEGKLNLNGKEYLAHLNAMRVEQDCLRCHGRPEDAPAAMVARYGPTAGFGRKVGEIAGLDIVAIPLDRLSGPLAREATAHVVTTALWLAALFGSILVAFRVIVTRRLAAVTGYFHQAAEQPENVAPIAIRGRDEISVLAAGFNALAERLRNFHASLEEQVAQRTADLEEEVVERKRAETALREEQQLLRQLLEVYEQHRKLVSYEIHDGVVQALTGALMEFEARLRQLPPDGPPETRLGFDRVQQLLRTAIEQARQVMAGLRPPILDDLGPVAAIGNLVCEIQNGSPMEIEYSHHVSFDRLAAPLETAIFRIVQESLTNACRHSKSDRMRIRLAEEDSYVRIEVEDWGVGFDPTNIDPSRFGLRGILERVRLFGGRATLDSSPGNGTRMAVELPIAGAVRAEE